MSGSSNLVKPRRQIGAAVRVEHEVAVADAAAGGEHIARLPADVIDRRAVFTAARRNVQCVRPEPLIHVDHDVEALGPRKIAFVFGIRLLEGHQQRAVLQPHVARDRRPARLFYPGPAPRREIVRSPPIEHLDQIRPGRVGVGVGPEVFTQPVAQAIGRDDHLELAHDDRRLLVDDRAVQAARLVEVVEPLADRVRALGAVDVVGGRVVRVEEPELVIDLREARVHDLRRHEVGEHLLHPDIVEPRHRHQVAEPHVRGLVRDQAGAAELLVLRRRGIEEQGRRVVEDGAGMLHAAELEGRHQQEVELLERIRDRGVLLEPGQRRGVQIEDRVAVASHLLRVRFAMEHPQLASTAFGGFHREPPRGEREQVGRDRTGFGKGPTDARSLRGPLLLGAVRDRLPAGRRIQRQLIARLQVRLVEAGERQTCARRHEQRVHELGIAIEREVARVERQRELVGAAPQRRGGKHDVLVTDRRRYGCALRAHVPDAGGRSGEVERQGPRRVRQLESQRDRAAHRRRDRVGNGDVQLVPEIADAAGAVLRQRQRDSCGRHVRRGVSIGHRLRLRAPTQRAGQHDACKQHQPCHGRR